MSMAMQHYMALLLVVAAGPGLAVGTSSVIATTCAAVSNFTLRTTGYNFCVGALSADPAGASATDARELAAVAANLTTANVTSTMVVVADLVGSLQGCLGIYRKMKESVAGAVDDIRAGRDDAASTKLSDAAFQPDWCDLLFLEGKSTKDPMREENLDAKHLSNMAKDIMDLLLLLHPPHRAPTPS